MKKVILSIIILIGCLGVLKDCFAGVIPGRIIEHNAQRDIINNLDEVIKF